MVQQTIEVLRKLQFNYHQHGIIRINPTSTKGLPFFKVPLASSYLVNEVCYNKKVKEHFRFLKVYLNPELTPQEWTELQFVKHKLAQYFQIPPN